MIREITEAEVTQHFLYLMAEVECGRHFDPNHPKHVAWIKHRIAVRFFQGARFFGYFLNGTVPIGFICVLLDDGPEGICSFDGKVEILAFGLLAEHRSKGYGTELLRWAEQFARDAGACSLYASTYALDHRVIAFYGRNGLVPVATLPDVHSAGDEGLVCMRKRLS